LLISLFHDAAKPISIPIENNRTTPLDNNRI
jgi:hypothetical protein